MMPQTAFRATIHWLKYISPKERCNLPKNTSRKLSKFIQTPEFLQLEPDRKLQVLEYLKNHIGFISNQLPEGGAAMGQENQNAVSGGEMGNIAPGGI